MTATISIDRRQHVGAAALNGENVRSVAASFEVAALSVVRWASSCNGLGPSGKKMGGQAACFSVLVLLMR